MFDLPLLTFTAVLLVWREGVWLQVEDQRALTAEEEFDRRTIQVLRLFGLFDRTGWF